MSMLTVLGLSLIWATLSTSPLIEPFSFLNGVDPEHFPAVPSSPDPLVRYAWDNTTNRTALQVYTALPVSAKAMPTSAFQGVQTTLSSGTNVTVLTAGSILLDFGVERAAWFEFHAPDLSSDRAKYLSAAISEYSTEPWDDKTRIVTGYEDGWYRLETNEELYEGVRFAWIFWAPPSEQERGEEEDIPWHITAVRVVAQVRATEYSGSYTAEDSLLERVWYTGAYGSRLNMHQDYFGSILMDRGDRVSIQGDGHPTMAAALVAFADPITFDLVHTMLNKTDSGCPGCHVIDDSIMPYPVYWTMSVNDWLWASGDVPRFLALVPDMRVILDRAVAQFLKPGLNVAWFGWDDRLGNGFCGTCNQEAQLAFAALLVRACRDLSISLTHAGQTDVAKQYSETADRLGSQLRNTLSPSGGAWYSQYGLHSAANLVNAETTTAAEEAHIFAVLFNNTATLCSWSNFNQYWNLQALGHMRDQRNSRRTTTNDGDKEKEKSEEKGKEEKASAMMMDYALASVRLCWGSQLPLGEGCFWELFNPEWTRFMVHGDKAPTRPSFCHPWADGATPWLTATHAGVTPLSPGYERVSVVPFVSNANLRVAATVATRHGPIVVEAAYLEDKQGEEEKEMWSSSSLIVIKVSSPVAAQVGVRSMLKGEAGGEVVLSWLAVDGRPHPRTVLTAGVDRLRGRTGRLHSNTLETHVFTALLLPGAHTVHAYYNQTNPRPQSKSASEVLNSPRTGAIGTNTNSNGSGNSSGTLAPLEQFPPFGPPRYRGVWSTDSTTAGSWQGSYGSKGYVLFAFDNGTDVNSLSPTTGTVTIAGKRAVSVFVGKDAKNMSYLEDPTPKRKEGKRGRRSSSSRALGFVTSGGDGSQGTVLDVNITGGGGGGVSRISLYWVGNVLAHGRTTWSARVQAVRVMGDLETLEPIAPVARLEDPNGKGVYFVLNYTGSVRLRVMPLEQDAGFSAVFFD